MDELIKQLRDYAEWAEKRPLEIPILLPVYLRQAADELEKRGREAMETNDERVKELVLSKLQEIAGEYYKDGSFRAFYVVDNCFLKIRELLDELDAESEQPKGG